MEVVGLTSSPQSSGSYALILQETGGDRRLSILIGQDPAQSIALELEAIRPPRPMTHDLMKSIIEILGVNLVDVTITELREGTFYAVIRLDATPTEIDARPSDAIALAIRCGSPIYVVESVLTEAGIQVDEEEFFDEDEELEEQGEFTGEDRPLTLREQLQMQLDEAVDQEDYERAAKIRDEIDRLDEAKGTKSS